MRATADGQFPHEFRLRVPRGLVAALAVAACRRQQTSSEFARQAILRSLEADGVRLRSGGTIEIVTTGTED